MIETTLAQKEKIREGIKANKSYGELAVELGMTKSTVKKWGQKIKRGDCLNPKLGRPKTGLLGTFAVEIKSLIDNYRPNNKGWGAVTIKTELNLEKGLKGKKKTKSYVNK